MQKTSTVTVMEIEFMIGILYLSYEFIVEPHVITLNKN